MNESNPKPELEIKSDSDWKQKVKKEAAELDAKLKDAPETASPGSASPPDDTSGAPDGSAQGPSSDTADAASSSENQLPTPDFTMLVSMFSTQAMVSLGFVPNPETGQAEKNLPLAKHFIDLLGVLQEKTRRNLTGHESNLLENSLHELRMAYVEFSRKDPEDQAAATSSN